MDIAARIEHLIDGNNRGHDPYLHCSSDLTGCLRCAQIRITRLEPPVEPSFGSKARLMTGTLWHSFFDGLFPGEPVMNEVDLTEYLPDRWSGTADLLRWEDAAFTLYDYKTIKPEAVRFLNGQPKPEHVWQVSAYHLGARRAGLPMNEDCYVVYIPMGAGASPLVLNVPRMSDNVLLSRMSERSRVVDAFHNRTLTHNLASMVKYLEPMLPREQKVLKVKDQFDVVLKPDWRSNYCPFPTLGCCSANHPNQEKIGHYDLHGNYHYRKGYENVQPTVKP